MPLETEVHAYEEKREELERHHKGKFVIFHGAAFIGTFDTFDAAGAEAIRRFGRGPYLIRQVGVSSRLSRRHSPPRSESNNADHRMRLLSEQIVPPHPRHKGLTFRTTVIENQDILKQHSTFRRRRSTG
jgi:hypothetical protein